MSLWWACDLTSKKSNLTPPTVGQIWFLPHNRLLLLKLCKITPTAVFIVVSLIWHVWPWSNRLSVGHVAPKIKRKKKKYNGPTFQWDIITLLFFHLYRCSFLKMSDESSQAAVGRERRWGAAGRRHLGQQSQGGRERELGRGRGRRGPGHADDGVPPHCPWP